MTPKARDLQGPGQHDMIEALRHALRQDNSEELNPRMQEALKGFRENLQFHPYVRWLEKRATIARTAGSPLFAFTRVRVVAGLVAIAGISIAGVLLITARPPNIFAAVLDAMEQVRTAHIVRTHVEIWFSREHGIRSEYGTIVCISTPQAIWEYDTRANKLIILYPDPEKTSKLLQELSGTQWLETLRNHPSLPYHVSDVVLDGRPMKRIDAEDKETRIVGTAWIDAETMRVIAIEQSYIQEDGSRTAPVREEVEYDIPIDAALFTLEPPADATVVDCRIDLELRDVIDEAMEAVETLPLHEIGEEAPMFHNEGRRFDRWKEWEGWRQNRVGHREEYSDGRVTGGTPREEWVCWERYAYVHDQDHYRNSFFTIRAHQWLRSLKQGRAGGWPADSPPEVIREEKDGHRLARIVGYFTHPPPAIEKNQSAERSKEVLTLDLDAKRLTERELYVWLDEEWRLAGRVQFDYPDELPPGIFDFDPPPGVKIDDLRRD